MKTNLFKQYIQKYQKRLHLLDWDINWQFAENANLQLKTRTAWIDYTMSSKKATVSIIRTRYEEIQDESYWEAVMFHELLHLLFTDLNIFYEEIVRDVIKDETAFRVLLGLFERKCETVISIVSNTIGSK